MTTIHSNLSINKDFHVVTILFICDYKMTTRLQEIRKTCSK